MPRHQYIVSALMETSRRPLRRAISQTFQPGKAPRGSGDKTTGLMQASYSIFLSLPSRIDCISDKTFTMESSNIQERV